MRRVDAVTGFPCCGPSRPTGSLHGARDQGNTRVCHTLGENFTRGLRRQPVSLFQDQGSLYFTESHKITDPSRAPTETTSKYWGVSWQKRDRRWKAFYKDANGKKRHIGQFVTQEAAAHAVNAAIRRAGLEGKRRTNPVVDGQLVPRETHKRGGKRHREEPAAADVPPPTRARRARRAVDYAAMEDPGLEGGGDWSS